jgi:hypothetical protein
MVDKGRDRETTMTQTAIRCGALVAVLVLSSACGASGPTSPTGRSEPPALSAPTPSPLSGSARIFTFEHGLSSGASDYTKKSRFVLYDNGAFALQYPICICGGEYLGRYTVANGVITFEWDGWSAAGSWGATGTLQGDTLTVQYNQIMQLTDFEDAVYLRMQ